MTTTYQKPCQQSLGEGGQRGCSKICCGSEDSVFLLRGLWSLTFGHHLGIRKSGLSCTLQSHNCHKTLTIMILLCNLCTFVSPYLYFQSPVSTLPVDLHPKYEWTWMPSSWNHHWSHHVAVFQEYRCESPWEKSDRFAGPHGEWKISRVLLVHVPSKGHHRYCLCTLLYSVWPQGVDHLWYACKQR